MTSSDRHFFGRALSRAQAELEAATKIARVAGDHGQVARLGAVQREIAGALLAANGGPVKLSIAEAMPGSSTTSYGDVVAAVVRSAKNAAISG